MGRRVAKVNQGIIGDLDGVIVASAPFHFDAWWAFAAAMGKALTREDFNRTFGMRKEDLPTGAW